MKKTYVFILIKIFMSFYNPSFKKLSNFISKKMTYFLMKIIVRNGIFIAIWNLKLS